ncbi:uncharacterized protein B0H18DRAFT_957545 [Fomitopsis serialis]|uniref:uncharacterized protein n=1 Tax=Fomitopsis serialis TaxID=139415 RepID=UPI0020080DAB|nr:uncharacterized protein B0H18DRAFT_957545 [Neoantrodia serialis]KAH9919409.1 hypothetical protein B0H18DRAFT_957545 [Neoantrodia serialis]
MFPRVFHIFTLICISVSLVSASPAPKPVAEPIDATIANVIATNENLGCTGPSGCVAAQNSSAAAEIFAASGASHSISAPGARSALVVAAAVAGGLSATGLL